MKEIVFYKSEMAQFAAFVSQLIREGVTWKTYRGYDSDKSEYTFVIELTGGF